MKVSFFQSQMEQSKIFEEDQDLRTSTLNPGQPWTDEKDKIIFEENQKGLLQPQDKTHHGMMVKPTMIFVLSQEILFTVITWNPSQTARAD